MVKAGWSGSSSGGGGVSVHSLLLGREDPDQHPVSAITGLAAALSSSKYRGAYPSVPALETAYPADVSGAYASVVTSGEANMYLWNDADQEWQDSGAAGVFVETVNGMTGPNVVLSPADIGAESAGEKGNPGGYASLGPDGRVPISQLPVSGISLNHENCTNRDAANSHPMTAITGLTAALDAKVDDTASSTGEWMESIDVEHDDPDSATVRVYTSKLDGSENAIEYEKVIYGAVAPGEDPETDPGTAGLMTAADKALLDSMPGQIGAVTGKLRYMPANDFGAAPEPEDLTAWATGHTGLDHVENSTAVINLYDNHEWIFNETGDEWIDNGISAVQTATNASLGVVKGSAADGGVSVGSDGTMAINGTFFDTIKINGNEI
jgi:hypothetical protein